MILPLELPITHLGNLYTTHGRFDEAEAILKEGIRMNPTYARIYATLGRLYSDIGRFNEMEQQFEKAIQVGFYQCLCLQHYGICLSKY